ncbi:MAG: hypothetical protein J5789_09945 [Oscillospiraceae bacterium]|nr:hypothetical protein [Oscillospiraceae bacterium]
MSKKIIMLVLYGISLVMLLYYATVQFSVYPTNMLHEDKDILLVKWPGSASTDALIDTLYAVSEECSADLALMLYSEEWETSFYRTERDPAFFRMDEWKQLEPGQTYVTVPTAGAETLPGFFFLFQDRYKIAPLRSLRQENLEMITGRLLVNRRDQNALSAALSRNGVEVFGTGEGGLTSAAEDLTVSIYALVFFFLISAVFYAFSRSKDMIVKKAMGYRNLDVVLAEAKPLGCVLLLISGVLLLLAGLLLSALAGFTSTLLFFRKNASLFLVYFCAALLVISLFLLFISRQCRVSHSKGKRLDRQLYAATAVFKTLVLLVLAGNLSSTVTYIGQLCDQSRATEAAAAQAEGYAWVSLQAEDITSVMSNFTPMYDFYRQMLEKHNLMIADFIDVTHRSEPTLAERIEFQPECYVTVNANYLDTFDTIYDADGVPIHSDRLVAGKKNMLVPQGYNYEWFDDEKRERTHLICYDAGKSRFFTFSNWVEGGYAVSGEIPILVMVYDLDSEEWEEQDEFKALQLSSAFSLAVFAYDSSSDLSPTEQIMPIFLEAKFNQQLGLKTETVKERFLIQLGYIRDYLVSEALKCAALLIALTVLTLLAAALYYKIYAKDIAAKALAGYSFFDLFSLRMVLKLALLPVMILMPTITISDYVSLPKISIWAAVFCLAVDVGLFVLCMKKNMRHKIAAVMKGE